jgi:retron-type reverse transcriptase
VDRELLFKIMRGRCRNESEKEIVGLIEKLHRNSIIEVGTSSLNAEMGLPQGSVLSPVLFNVYLEEALNSSELL